MLKRLSITFWTTLFVMCVCVSLVIVDGWRSWNARAVQLLDAENGTSNLARAMAQQGDDAIKSAETALTGIVERVEFDGVGQVALLRLHQLLVQHVVNLAQLNNLLVYDAAGNWLVNALPQLDRTQNNADREYFIFHQTNPGRGLHIGPPILSRSTGKWVIPVSRRIDRADGSFGGVALATIDIAYFRNFYQSLNIGKKGAVALLSNSGSMLLRLPFSELSIGKNVSGTPLFLAYAAHHSAGSVTLKSVADGEVRLYSYRPLQHYPLFVMAALARDEVLDDWRSDALLHFGGVLVLAALMALFGRRLIRQIGLRAQAESDLLVARDALQALNGKLEKLALQDSLTGLANRRQFDVTLGNEFGRAMRTASALAFVMIDVDCFKQYNDSYGHVAGDACLQLLSQTIRSLVPGRPGDLAARYGGEEIGILLPSTGLDGALAVAEKIRLAIAGLKIAHAGSPSGIVTISAGVASLIPQLGKDYPGALLDAADKALYAAKSAGRNRAVPARAHVHEGSRAPILR